MAAAVRHLLGYLLLSLPPGAQGSRAPPQEARAWGSLVVLARKATRMPIAVVWARVRTRGLFAPGPVLGTGQVSGTFSRQNTKEKLRSSSRSCRPDP